MLFLVFRFRESEITKKFIPLHNGTIAKSLKTRLQTTK